MGAHASSDIALSDLVEIGGVPYVLSTDLARAVATSPATVHRLISNVRSELEGFGPVIDAEMMRAALFERAPPSLTRGRRFYLLGEGQALLLLSRLRAARASQVRVDLIKACLLVRLRLIYSFKPTELAPLVPAERRALRHICARGDVVTGPPIFFDGNFWEVDPTGTRTYLVTPLDDELIDTLAAFEAEAADAEQDDELEEDDPSGGSDGGVDDEGEPALGAPAGTGNQAHWAQGVADDRELDTADEEPWLAAGCDGTVGASVDQTRWGRDTAGDDRELDAADTEASLGAPENFDQSFWGVDYRDHDLEADGAETHGAEPESAVTAAPAAPAAPPPTTDWGARLWTVNVDTGELTPPRGAAGGMSTAPCERPLP